MNENDGKRLICEACRTEFGCFSASGRCWCFEIKIAPPMLLHIREKYGDCLCNSCLDKLSSEFAAANFTAGENSL